MSELLRYRNTLAALTLIILFVKDVENFHQKNSKNTILWRGKKKKKKKRNVFKYSKIFFFSTWKISNLINYSTDMCSIASFKPSSGIFLKKNYNLKKKSCFVTWFANVGLFDHHPLVVPSRWKLVMSLRKRLLWCFPLGPMNKSKNLLQFCGKVVLVTASTGACFRTGFKRLPFQQVFWNANK